LNLERIDEDVALAQHIAVPYLGSIAIDKMVWSHISNVLSRGSFPPAITQYRGPGEAVTTSL
jgi:hypothetical protein